MGQELNGSLGSWVTLSDPFPALHRSASKLLYLSRQWLRHWLQPVKVIKYFLLIYSKQNVTRILRHTQWRHAS